MSAKLNWFCGLHSKLHQMYSEHCRGSVSLLVNADLLHLWNEHLQQAHDGLQWELRLPGQSLRTDTHSEQTHKRAGLARDTIHQELHVALHGCKCAYPFRCRVPVRNG